MADHSKRVPVLGAFPLPVAVAPFAGAFAARRISELGAAAEFRLDDRREPFLTDDGGYILDCRFGTIADPAALARELDRIPGIVEHGLFIDMASTVILAQGDSVMELHRR